MRGRGGEEGEGKGGKERGRGKEERGRRAGKRGREKEKERKREREREREGGGGGERDQFHYPPGKTLNHIRHYAEEGLYCTKIALHMHVHHSVQVMHNVIITIVTHILPHIVVIVSAGVPSSGPAHTAISKCTDQTDAASGFPPIHFRCHGYDQYPATNWKILSSSLSIFTPPSVSIQRWSSGGCDDHAGHTGIKRHTVHRAV